MPLETPCEKTEARPSPGPQRRSRRPVLFASVSLFVGVVVFAELRYSTFEAWLFPRIVSDVVWAVEEGPSPRIRFPGHGPFDRRMGYVDLPLSIDRARDAGYGVVAQAHVSSRFASLVDWGAFPIYPEKIQGGLHLTGHWGRTLLRTPRPAHVYETFDSIPELLWRSLIHIESRELLDSRYPRKNPALEWDRLIRSVAELALRAGGSNQNVSGGSTLATQLEKFRHSPGGLTRDPSEKLRQMVSASLRAYRTGPETLTEQRRIVRDYLNSVPLAAQVGHGEVIGTAEGLWAWYGTSFDEANRLLRGVDLSDADIGARARVYRQALSLLIAHRRPSFYLTQAQGRAELGPLTDRYLRQLAQDGVIPQELAKRALSQCLTLLSEVPAARAADFVEHKAANQVRAELLNALRAPSLYVLDRWDLRAATTYDVEWQAAATELFASLKDESFVRRHGFAEDRLLGDQDPTRVLYSITLLEKTPLGNVVRIQTDNYDGPLNLSAASQLELGSTAKLRTLVTYLEAVAELHARFFGTPADELRRERVAPQDRLTAWGISYLLRAPDADLAEMLEAAMSRGYSASPAERFSTGGGVQTFSNFDRAHDTQTLSVRDAFRHSVNLPFIRLMRDVVNYRVFGKDPTLAVLLEDQNHLGRTTYLARFADLEGSRFLRDFHRKYQNTSGAEILERLVMDRGLDAERVARIYRAVAPDATGSLFAEFVRRHGRNASLSDEALAHLHANADPAPYDLNDLGYLTRVHPLELWVARYLVGHPHATLPEVLAASADVRQEVYRWLFRTRRTTAQNQRIRTVLEVEAFQEIHGSWTRLGYPFSNIVPSLGSAIGSSADRPLALAELVGIIVNGGVRFPVVRVEQLLFAQDTPFETRLARTPAAGERVLPAEVAAVARSALLDVVENGTGRRVRGAVVDSRGDALAIGGKTGTGDNRFRTFGPGGRVTSERVINRTSTFAFFIGDRHFGVVTAHVPGPEAGRYRFTSALASEVVRQLGPALSGANWDSGGAPPGG